MKVFVSNSNKILNNTEEFELQLQSVSVMATDKTQRKQSENQIKRMQQPNLIQLNRKSFSVEGLLFEYYFNL